MNDRQLLCFLTVAQTCNFSRAARQLYITEIHHDFPDADTFFPAIDPAVWEEVEREDFPADDRHAYPYSFVTYRRR